MFKKYDYRLVKTYITYSIPEICRLFKDFALHEQTVREWVRTGQISFYKDGNKILIYGAVLKKFLKNRNKGRARSLKETEFLCYKCKTIAPPLEHIIISLSENKNGCFTAVGICANCAAFVNRIYKRAMGVKLQDIFKLEPEALIILSDILCSISKTHIKTDPKPALHESLPNRLSNVTNSESNEPQYIKENENVEN